MARVTPEVWLGFHLNCLRTNPPSKERQEQRRELDQHYLDIKEIMTTPEIRAELRRIAQLPDNDWVLKERIKEEDKRIYGMPDHGMFVAFYKVGLPEGGKKIVVGGYGVNVRETISDASSKGYKIDSVWGVDDNADHYIADEKGRFFDPYFGKVLRVEVDKGKFGWEKAI